MKVVKRTDSKEVRFEDLADGDTFTNQGSEQIWLKTNKGLGCILEDGTLIRMDDDEKVTPVNCEVTVT